MYGFILTCSEWKHGEHTERNMGIYPTLDACKEAAKFKKPGQDFYAEEWDGYIKLNDIPL